MLTLIVDNDKIINSLNIQVGNALKTLVESIHQAKDNYI